MSWTFVLGSLWRHTDLTTAGGIVALAYPFGDMVIIFLIVLSVRSMTATGRRPLLSVLLAGLFAMAVSDSTYAYLVEVGRYATGNLVDIGWVVGSSAIAVGTWAMPARRSVPHLQHEPDEASLVSLVTPYVVLALSVITFELELHHHVDRFSWLTGFALSLLALPRQALLFVDRRRELFSASNGPHEPGPKSTGSPPLYESEPEAAPWPQFLRRTP